MIGRLRQLRKPLSNFDRWVDEFAWAPDSERIYFAYGDSDEERIDSAQVDGSHLTRLTKSGEYGDLHATPDGKFLIASKMTVRMPGEVYVLNLEKKQQITAERLHGAAPPAGSEESATYAVVRERQLSHLNDVLLSELEMPEMETFFFPSLGRVRVQGFLIKPPGFDVSKKYPVKFLIHGGPEGAWGDSWSYRWDAELFAANGYVVVMVIRAGRRGMGRLLSMA